MITTVLFAAYSHGSVRVRGGLSYHLLCNALAIREAANGVQRIVIASTPEEDVPGLWDRARKAFPEKDIFMLDDEDAAFTVGAQRALEQSERLVIHVQGTRQLRAAAAIRDRARDRVRIVYTVHSFRNATWKRIPYCVMLRRELRRHADYTIFLSPAEIHEFIGSRRLLRDGRAGLIPLGVADWPEWRDRSPGEGQIDEHLRDLLDQSDAFRFVYLAAFKSGKGHMWLMKAAAEVLRNHEQAQLILAGWGDEAIRRAVAAEAVRAGIRDRVCLSGGIRRDFVPWLLGRCHCAVMPSRSETFGQVIAESMAAGLPVIGTRRGIGAQVILDGITGYGVPYGHETSLRHAMGRLIGSPSEAARMGSQASALVQVMYNWAAIAKAHLTVYASIFNNAD